MGLWDAGLTSDIQNRKQREQEQQQFTEKMQLERDKFATEKEMLPFQKLQSLQALQSVEKQQAQREGWGNARKLYAAKYGLANMKTTPTSSLSNDLAQAIVSGIKNGNNPNIVATINKST